MVKKRFNPKLGDPVLARSRADDNKFIRAVFIGYAPNGVPLVMWKDEEEALLRVDDMDAFDVYGVAEIKEDDHAYKTKADIEKELGIKKGRLVITD